MTVHTNISGYDCIFDDDVPLAFLGVCSTMKSPRIGYTKGDHIGKSFVRILLSAPAGMQVDHINGNPLDNRRENLRLCTASQNMMNQKLRKGKKLPKGVSRTSCSRYIARATYKGITYNLGVYVTPELAHTAYKQKAEELVGDFASHISRNNNL